MSESIELGILLAICGGFLDAYSYIGRGGVFSNAQTGNMLLLGVNLSEGNFHEAMTFFVPICSYAVGIMLADYLHDYVSEHFHWRQIAILAESFILCIVAFIPFSNNYLANCLSSCVCAIQYQAFRKIRGKGIATTMCMGNLRSVMVNFDIFLKTHDKKAISNAFLYLLIISSFVGGAVLGNILLKQLGQYSILFCSSVLFVCFLIMFIDREHSDDEKLPQEF